MRKGNSPQSACSPVAHRLKLAALLVFCSFASMMIVPRFVSTTATSVSPGPGSAGNLSAVAPENLEPELNTVRFKRVGVGQRITFGLSVIDEESDDVRVELIQKPRSAKYNEKTLT
ncbi:MAG TPA: hypothetical protein VGO69_00010, partial [Pyrinomonadaceae bacterium]|nr:hypothetical protein [Pyrinomonadaceae bacterium]